MYRTGHRQLKTPYRTAGRRTAAGDWGGRVLDAAKAAASQLPAVTLVNFATQAATCAAWSPIAIIYNEQGGHLHSQPLGKMPELVLVDSEVIARSDVRYLKAGIVDALAKYYEFRPYQQHNPDDLALDLKVMTARQALDTFRQQGDAAILACQQQRVTPELVRVIDATIVLAGLANSVRDLLPTPGFAHAIHNRLTHLPELHHWLHGEKVGFSLLVQSLMEHDGVADAELLALLRHYDMPLKLPVLRGDRHSALRNLAQQIKFPRLAQNGCRLASLPARWSRRCWRRTPFFKRALWRAFSPYRPGIVHESFHSITSPAARPVCSTGGSARERLASDGTAGRSH